MMLDHALKLAKKGFHVFPLLPQSKLPLIKDYPNLATRDEAQIKAWFSDWPDANVGISTTKYGDDEALVAIDVDNKNGKKGSDVLKRLKDDGREIPKTFTQTTPSGGLHIVYRVKHAVKQGTDVLGPGLDIRSRGGYLVGDGSSLEGGTYSSSGSDLDIAPEWLVETCGRELEREPRDDDREIDIDPARAAARATRYLINHAPVAVSGEGGDELTFKVACRVRDEGVDEAMCFELMLDSWNSRCEPPWSPNELRSKVRNAYAYANGNSGNRAAESQFTPIEEETIGDYPYLEEINKDHALIFLEGSHMILHETVDQKGRPHRVYMNEVTFRRKFSPKIVSVSRGRTKTQADIWLDWPNRREYAGICFAPERHPGHNYFNTWTGFTCEPIPYAQAKAQAKRGFDAFLKHARENVCRGIESHFQWLMGYFAHMIQKPYERPLTTVVLQGSKGTGKNAIVDRVGHLLGRHYISTADVRYLTSNFNGQFDECLFMVFDEAFWSGDKAAEGKLKSLTTQKEILIERKGKETYKIDNLCRFFVIGNEEWLVNATEDERRWAVFKMGEGNKQDTEFFHNMRLDIEEHGGDGVLLHYLKTFDLNSVNINRIPKTSGLAEQKVASLDLIGKWISQSLVDGKIYGADFGDGWPETYGKAALREAFRRFCKDLNITSRFPDRARFGKRLKEILPKIGTDGRVRDQVNPGGYYTFPDLKTCRADFETLIGQQIDWDRLFDN